MTEIGTQTVTDFEIDCTTGDELSGGSDVVPGADLTDTPSWHITLTAALQLVLTNVGAIIAAAFVVHGTICAGDNNVLLAELLSTALFMSGLSTLLQVSVGVRLPILQASSYAFFPVISAMMNTPKWQCPETAINATVMNANNSDNIILSSPMVEPWVPRLLELSGSLAAASCFQVFIGCSGLVGFLLNFIGPITTIPIISLVGLTVINICIPGMRSQWAISVLCTVLILICSLLLRNVMVPLPAYANNKGFYTVRYPLFRLYPNLVAICVTWLVCYILTVTDVFPPDPSSASYKARTDIKLDTIYKSTWWFVPYPGRWGVPTFEAGTFVGMLAAVMASIIESMADYHATARVCDVPPPPKHAMNRGIAVEGVTSILSGLVGACHATTSYSNNCAHIQITGVRSRVVWLAFGGIMIVCGLCGKVGAAMSMVPEPVIAATLFVSLGMVASIGWSGVKQIQISSRNMLIVGVAICTGIMLPNAIMQDPTTINTGYSELNQVLTIVLSTGLFVGGIIAALLDNIVPGSRFERGMAELPTLGNDLPTAQEESQMDVYDIPLWTEMANSVNCPRFIPFLPSYRADGWMCFATTHRISNGSPKTSKRGTARSGADPTLSRKLHVTGDHTVAADTGGGVIS